MWHPSLSPYHLVLKLYVWIFLLHESYVALCVYCWETRTSRIGKKTDVHQGCLSNSIYWTYGILLDQCQHWFWLVQFYWVFLSSWQMTIKIREQYKQKKNESWINFAHLETLPYFSHNFDFGFLGLVHITFLILKSSLEISKTNQWRNVLRIT